MKSASIQYSYSKQNKNTVCRRRSIKFKYIGLSWIIHAIVTHGQFYLIQSIASCQLDNRVNVYGNPRFIIQMLTTDDNFNSFEQISGLASPVAAVFDLEAPDEQQHQTAG